MQIRTADVTGNDITSSLSSATQAMDFFMQNNNAEKSAFANFVVARVYEKQDNKVKALHYYTQADNWAEKAGYNIKNFNYSSIPYNIAVLLWHEAQYEKSLAYCRKRLEYLNDKAKYTSHLYTNELIALNYTSLNNRDSALAYYNKASLIAGIHHDTKGKYRIASNKCLLYLNTKEYDAAKNEYFTLFPLEDKSKEVNKSKFYLILSDVYKNTGKIDSASVFLNKALSQNNSIETQIELYKRLYQLEQVKGSKSTIAVFEEQYLQLVKDKENSRKSETDELKAEISRMKGQQLFDLLEASHQSWLQAQKRREKEKNLWYGIGISLLAALIFALRQKAPAGDETWEAATPKGNEQRRRVFREKIRYDKLVKLYSRIECMVNAELELKLNNAFSRI